MLLNVIRFMRGYVDIAVSGRFPERFINITSRNGVRIWDVRRGEDTVTASMYMSDCRRIRRLARSSGVSLNVRGRHGLPVLAARYRDRLGLVIGGFVFILTVFMMSQFIWSIDVTGLESISESELRSALSDHGLYIGAFKPAIDPQSVSRAVMLDNGKVGWMAVNITGSYASVEVKEEASAPEVNDDTPCNVKASRDGVILDIAAKEGDVLLKEGSGVVKGQLLISGVMDDLMGGVRLVHADAVIHAATAYAVEFSVPESAAVTLPTGELGERRTLSLFGLNIPLTGYSAGARADAVRDRLEKLRVLDTDLPVGIVAERVAGMSEKQISYDNNSAEELLVKQAQLYEAFTLSRCTVSGRSYDLSREDGVYTLSVIYDCVEDIAVQSPIGTG